MKNILTSILNICTYIIVGLVIPKLFLEFYGPSFHGCISTANNLSNYVLLLTAGLTTAAVQALYSPISSNDHNLLSSIYNAIDKSYSKISYMILLSFIILSILMPFIIGKEIDQLIIICIYLIIGLQFFLDNLLLRKYNVIITADNRISVLNLLNTFTYLFQAILQITIIKTRLPIYFYLAVPVIVVLIKYTYVRHYVSKKYSFIDPTVTPKSEYLSKRWNAFVHQISGIILYNTDALLLTIACNQIVVSIYIIYNMIFINVYSFLTQVCSSSLVARFGKLYCTVGLETFKSNVYKYDSIYRILMFTIYGTMTVSLLPFISLYTKNIDVKYENTIFAFLFIVANMLSSARVPAMTIVDAVGHYKQTQKQAIIEATLNLSVSLLLVFKFGIIGVLIGTIVSFLYRTFAMIHYLYHDILSDRVRHIITTYVMNFVNIIVIFWVVNKYIVYNVDSWFQWILISAYSAVIVFAEVLSINYYVDKHNTKSAISSIFNRFSALYLKSISQ